MTLDQIILSIVLIATLWAFADGRLRYDLVAAAALMACVLAGLVEADAAFLGFGHPAVITVAAVLIISVGLKNSGVMDRIARSLRPYTKTQMGHVMSLTLAVTLASAFMNNVGALALLLPVALSTSNDNNRSPALVLMPLAFGSIVGGLITLIGTPPNIIISSFRTKAMGEPFQMFDFAYVGAPVAIASALFLGFFGWRLIPRERLASNTPKKLFEVADYLTEVRIPENSKIIDKRLDEVAEFERDGVEIVGYASGQGRFAPIFKGMRVAADDVYAFRGDPEEIVKSVDDLALEIVSATGVQDKLPSSAIFSEFLVTEESQLVGRNVYYLRQRSGNAVSLMAVAREGQAINKRLRRLSILAGDILLLRGDETSLQALQRTLHLLPLAARDLRIGTIKKGMGGIAIAIFALAIFATSANILPVAISFTLAIGAYVAINLVPLRDLYDSVEWPVIVLLALLMPVAFALESTGLTRLIADQMVDITQGLPMYVILAVLLVTTSLISSVVNNAATALVMAPIAIEMARTLNQSIDPFLMAAAIGASCAFLTPIGHQSNTLVMAPGGYSFGDYWRVGLPLTIVVTLVSVPFIVWFWL